MEKPQLTRVRLQMTANDDLALSLRELLEVIERQHKEAPDLIARTAVLRQLALVEGWIDRVNIGKEEQQAVLIELDAVSKALDAYYSWSKFTNEREKAITKVWEIAALLRSN